MKVSAKTKQKPTPVTVEYDIPEKLEDLTKKFGGDVVAAHANGSIVISLQAAMRRLIEKGKTQAEIQAAIKDWKPDVRSAVKMSAFEKAVSQVDKLSDQERRELLAKLTRPAAAQPAKA